MQSEGNQDWKGPTARIVVVDDHPVVRQGLVLTLGRQPGISICGEASGMAEALKVISESKPDLVLSDLDLDGASGIDLIKNLKADIPGLAVLVLSMHDEEVYAERVLRAGARGYLMKKETPEKIADGVRQALAGEIVLSPKMKSRILGSLSGAKPSNAGSSLENLSDRELEVFRLIWDGLTTRLMAEKLSLSIKTVEAHLAHIKSKLGAESGRELQRRAYAWTTGAGAPPPSA
jgi:DNA-binding NarL/FixJ family response regulator